MINILFHFSYSQDSSCLDLYIAITKVSSQAFLQCLRLEHVS